MLPTTNPRLPAGTPFGNCTSSDMHNVTPFISTTTPELPIITGGRSRARSEVTLTVPSEVISTLTPAKTRVSGLTVPPVSRSGSHLSPFMTTGTSRSESMHWTNIGVSNSEHFAPVLSNVIASSSSISSVCPTDSENVLRPGIASVIGGNTNVTSARTASPSESTKTSTNSV